MNEWKNEPVIINSNLDLNALTTNRHSVVAVDFTLYKGKKSLIIDDSWGFASAMNGQQNDDIKMLQNILKNEGLFPSNPNMNTGYYGAITAKAVLQWQIKHSVADLLELNSLAGRRVGEKTIKKLNEIY